MGIYLSEFSSTAYPISLIGYEPTEINAENARYFARMRLISQRCNLSFIIPG